MARRGRRGHKTVNIVSGRGHIRKGGRRRKRGGRRKR